MATYHSNTTNATHERASPERTKLGWMAPRIRHTARLPTPPEGDQVQCLLKQENGEDGDPCLLRHCFHQLRGLPAVLRIEQVGLEERYNRRAD
eukprot:gene2000-biopygen5171